MTARPGARRLWMMVIAAVALVAVVLVVLRMVRPRSAAPAITTVAVGRQDLTVTIEATGTVEPIDLVEVKSKASGQILRMPVEGGSKVKVGDLLAEIDKVDVENQYQQALAALKAAQAKDDISRAQKQRADDLFAQHITTADEHEAATLDFANAESQLVKARTDLDSARQRRADATVRAPIAGTVLEQLVSVGQVISSATSSVSGGTSLLRMADLSRIRLRALVAETDIGNVRPGQPATVTVDAFPQRPFQGQVEKIEPQAVVQQSVTMFPVLISISNQDGLLLPGMNGEVSMLVDQRNGVVAVPIDAVRSVRELPALAVSLGMNADSLRAQVQRQQDARARDRAARAGADSSGARLAAAGGTRTGGDSSGTRRRWMGRAGAGGAGGGAAGGRGAVGAAGAAGGAMGGRGAAGAAGAGAGAMGSRAQIVFVKTAHGLEPRLVRLGLTNFDYAEVLGGVQEGDEVALLSLAELQAKRAQAQSQLKARMGSGVVPGVPGGGAAAGGRGAGR